MDEYVVGELRSWTSTGPNHASAPNRQVATADLVRLFDAQAQARQLDFAAHWLRARDEGFYTIGSAGHEANAAVAMALRSTDPALLHYRSGGFYAARAAQADSVSAIRDVLHSLACAQDDPISGGRHKVFGHPRLAVIPQTSTISSHLPRALGLAFALDLRPATGVHGPWPDDAVVVCSFGDASINHSTATGSFNAAGYLSHRRRPLPLLFVCEDNGYGISTRSPHGWVEHALRGTGLDYHQADGRDAEELLLTSRTVVDQVRRSRRPAVLHLRTVRFGGHAGSDAESGYRTAREIARDYPHDPLLGTARALVARGLTADELLARYEDLRERVHAAADEVVGSARLMSAAQVMEPLTRRRRVESAIASRRESADRATLFAGQLPEQGPPLTLAQTINATLTDALGSYPNALIFGEDVAVKGGVYGVTRGLHKRFGARVFDTLLDEQTILGTALGSALAGYLPIPEIQYLAYLHNAEDQLRGEGASLRFFSAGQYGNGMVVRIAGLAYQKGFGGHFHNDNSVAVLRDIPGLVLAVPAHPTDAVALLRTCVGLAVAEQRVCVFLEPIARYHTRDLLDGDAAWTAPYQPASHWDSSRDGLGRTRRHGVGRDLLIVTFGNGVYLSSRCLPRLASLGINVTILDLRWLAPLPEDELAAIAADFDRVLIVDETRRSGGVGEAIITSLVERGFDGRLRRVASADSFIPLGPAADTVLLGEDDIVEAATALMTTPERPR